MPNWGTTWNVNPYVYSSFGAYGWTSNFGYETQFNIFPDTMTPLMAQYSHGILNPNHISQWNPMFAYPISNEVTNPVLVQKGLNDAADYAETLFNQYLDGQYFMSSVQAVEGIINGINNLLKSKDLTDEQKGKLNAILDKANALKERLEKYQEDMQAGGKDKTALSEELTAIKVEVEALAKESSDLCKEIKKEIEAAKTGKKDGTDGTEGTDKKDGTEGTEGTDKKDGTEGTEGTGKKDGTEGTEGTGKKDGTEGVDDVVVVDPQVALNIANVIYNTGNGFNVVYGTLTDSMNKINQDNIVEVLNAWNAGRGKDLKQSLAEYICANASDSDKIECLKKLLYTFEQRAVKDNINIADEVKQINDKLEAYWIKDFDGICKLMNKIHEKLGGQKLGK